MSAPNGFQPPGGAPPFPPHMVPPAGYGGMAPPGMMPPAGMMAPPMGMMAPPVGYAMGPPQESVMAPRDPKLTTAFVSGLATDMPSDFIKRVIQCCGMIVNFKRAEDPVTKKGSGFAFCEFENAEGVLRALRLLNGLSVGEKQWKVKIDEKAQKFVDTYAEKRKDDLRRRIQSQGGDVNGDLEDEEQARADKTAMANMEAELTGPDGPNRPAPGDAAGRGVVIDRMVEEIAESTNLQNWESRERYTSAGVNKDKARLVSSEILAFRDRLEASEKEKKERERKEKEKKEKEQDPAAALQQALLSEAEEVERQERREKDRERDEERRVRDKARDMDRRYRDKLHAVEKLEGDIRRHLKREAERPDESIERERRRRRELEDDEDSEPDEDRRARNRRDDRWQREKEKEKKADEVDRAKEREEIESARRKQEEEERRRVEELRAQEEARRRAEEENRIRVERAEKEKQEAAEALKSSFAKRTQPVKKAPATAKPALFDAAVAEEHIEENANKMRPLVPIEYTEEEMQAVDPEYAKKAQENLAKRLKQLIDSIPEEEDKLFAYEVEWDVVEKHDVVDKKMKSWVTKKIVELFGVEEKDFISFILKNLKKRSTPTTLLQELEPVLEAEAPKFVAKMWRMMIFEVLRAKEGV